MTEKIIINGVNVAKCRHFDIDDNRLGVYDCYQNELTGFCKSDPNCFYKQLQVEKQKRKKLKEDLKTYKQTFVIMKHNCWNCKHCSNQYRNPFAKTLHYCKKQQAWIYKMSEECPKFEIKLFSRIFGDRSPELNTIKKELVGGCKK